MIKRYVARRIDFNETVMPLKESPRKRMSNVFEEVVNDVRSRLSKSQPKSFQSTAELTGQGSILSPLSPQPFNIFKEAEQADRKKYVDVNIGPKTDPDGNIVRWSIIGKPEQFQRAQQARKKGVQIGPQQLQPTKKGSQPKLTQGYSRNMSIREEDGEATRTAKELNHQQSSSSDIRLQTAQTQKTNVTIKSKNKKVRSEFKLVPKQDLLMYMQNVRSRVDSNEQFEQQFEKSLAPNMRNELTRQKRTMEKFDQQLEIWEEQVNILSANCEREMPATLITRTEDFRRRVERVNAVECTKSDQEKYNNRLWYLRLRNYEDHVPQFIKSQQELKPQFDLTVGPPKQEPRLSSRMMNRYIKDERAEQLHRHQEFVLSDIFSGFNTKIVDNPSQQIEIVRRPLTREKQSAPLFSSKFENMYDARLKRYPDKLKSKMIHVKESETDKLMLEGQNVFERELKSLQSDGAPLMAQYQKHELQKDSEEVLVEQWDVRALSRTGEHFYPQLSKVNRKFEGF